jgi:glycosyltransferase involved in cell wall biosynthesis
MPLVSIVVPSFNHAQYLERRLDSIGQQLFQDVELILLDDASTDGSREICSDFARRHSCDLLLREKNSGTPFKQWSAGIQRSNGKYIWIAESDDIAEADFLGLMVQLLEQNPGCGLAYCNSIRIDATGQPMGLAVKSFSEADPAHWAHDHVVSGREELLQFMLFENTIPNASAVVFRRSAYDTVGGADESMSLCADWKLWASIMAISNVAYSATRLNYFRCHDQTVRASSKAWPILVETLSVMRHITRNLELSPSMKQRLDVRIWVLFLDTFRRQLPALREIRATVKMARELHLDLSLKVVWLLLERIFNAGIKRVASLMQTTTAQR